MARISETVSQRVQNSMRKAIAAWELLRAHVDGAAELQTGPCAQCLEADMQPMRVRSYCDAGRDLKGNVLDNVAIASMLISQAEQRAGLAPTFPKGARFDLAGRIRRFYDYEFTGPLTPRPRRPVERKSATLPTRIEVTAEEMAKLQGAGDVKPPSPKTPQPNPAPNRKSKGS